MAGFGNNASDGYNAHSYKYLPAWEKDVDYNPDHQPSSSRLITTTAERNANEVLMLIEVRWLGVLTFHSVGDEFVGVALYTNGEIGI